VYTLTGKVLATGHQSGAVALYNVEKCEMMQQACPHPPGVPVVSLTWVDAASDGQAHTNYARVRSTERVMCWVLVLWTRWTRCISG